MPLFKTTAELKQYYPARTTFDLEDLAPTLKRVEREYLRDQVLGEAQLNELQSAYDADTLSGVQEDLLMECRTVVANLGIYHFTGLANVEFSSGGLVSGQTEHKRPASEWRTRDLERAVLSAGYRGLDDLLGYLHAHRSDFPTWRASAQYAAWTKGFLRSTRDFQERVAIGNSGYLFSKMLPVIRRIEQGVIAETLCSATYAASLESKLTAGTLSANELKVVKLVQMATAHLTMADSIVELSLSMDDRGVWVFGSLLGGSTSGGPTPADVERLQNRIDHHTNLGKGALTKLTAELQAQAVADETHPYRTSTCYVDPDAEQKDRFKTDSPVGGFMA